LEDKGISSLLINGKIDVGNLNQKMKGLTGISIIYGDNLRPR